MHGRERSQGRTRGFRTMLMLGPLIGGCADVTMRPNLNLLPQSPPYAYNNDDWARVLGNYVQEGLVKYEALSRDRELLERHYALLSVSGPSRTSAQFTSASEVTAYWLNAYNALVLLTVLERYPVTTMYDLAMPRLEYDYKFLVDGRALTLGEIEERFLESSNGDVRTLFATSRAAMGTPRLSAEPYRGDSLERQLAVAAAEALDDPRILTVNHGTQRILLWQLILRRQNEFVDYWRRRRRVRTTYLFNVLLDLASPRKRRELQSAVGYDFQQVPFDRALNQWSPPPPDRPVVP